MNEQTLERIAKALESIAESLAKLARPPMIAVAGGADMDISGALRPGPAVRTSPDGPVTIRQFDPAQPMRIVPVEGKVS